MRKSDISNEAIPTIPAIAGYDKGIHKTIDGPVNVLGGPSIIEPVKGDCSLVRKGVEDRLGNTGSYIFWGWLRQHIAR